MFLVNGILFVYLQVQKFIEFYGVDWFWQQAEVIDKHAVIGCVLTLIRHFNFLTGNNEYALAA